MSDKKKYSSPLLLYLLFLDASLSFDVSALCPNAITLFFNMGILFFDTNALFFSISAVF